MIHSSNIRAGLEDLAASLLPGLEPYIVLTSERPPAEHLVANAVGWTSPTLDLALRGWFKKGGRWQGRRPCVVIDDLLCWKWAREESTKNLQPSTGFFHQTAAGILIHELAHIADLGLDLSEPTKRTERLARSVNSREYPLPAAPVPWAGHCEGWLRCVLHLRFRALQIGRHTALDVVFDSMHYGLSPSYDYWKILLGEMKRLRDVPIFEIAKVPPPLSFVKRWHSDIRRWRARQDALSENALLSVNMALC